MPERKKLGLLDRFLTLGIFLAMALGVGAGYFWPGVAKLVNRFSVGTTNIPIAVGLILMMYPPLAKVKYEELGDGIPELEGVGAVAGAELGHRPGPDVLPGYHFPARIAGLHVRPDNDRPGALHRHGDCVERAGRGRHRICRGPGRVQLDLPGAFLLGLRLVFHHRVAAWFGLKGTVVNVTIAQIAKSVFIYLGIPFFAGMLTRFALITAQGQGMVSTRVHSQDQPAHADRAALHDRGDVSLKGEYHRADPAGRGPHRHSAADLFRGDVPGQFLHEQEGGRDYAQSATLSFTAASNNFELAIAVAVAVFGINSRRRPLPR